MDRRRRVAQFYDEALAGVEGISPLAIPPACGSNYYKYIALLDPGIDLTAVKQELRREHGVGMSGEVYAGPLHRQPIFSSIPAGPLPVAEDVCARHVCLPVHSDMTDGEADHVVASLRQVLGSRTTA